MENLYLWGQYSNIVMPHLHFQVVQPKKALSCILWSVINWPWDIYCWGLAPHSPKAAIPHPPQGLPVRLKCAQGHTTSHRKEDSASKQVPGERRPCTFMRDSLVSQALPDGLGYASRSTGKGNGPGWNGLARRKNLKLSFLDQGCQVKERGPIPSSWAWGKRRPAEPCNR